MLIVTVPVLIFSPRRQRIGDLLSRTFVVRSRASTRHRPASRGGLCAGDATGKFACRTGLKKRRGEVKVGRDAVPVQTRRDGNGVRPTIKKCKTKNPTRLILASVRRAAGRSSRMPVSLRDLRSRDAEDAIDSAHSPQQLAIDKARAKARAARHVKPPFPAFVVGADTLVAANGKSHRKAIGTGRTPPLFYYVFQERALRDLRRLRDSGDGATCGTSAPVVEFAENTW